jgi:hypothetical protein
MVVEPPRVGHAQDGHDLGVAERLFLIKQFQDASPSRVAQNLMQR